MHFGIYSFVSDYYDESFISFVPNLKVGQVFCFQCSVFAAEEDYSLEKKVYKYCGVELSYASFTEYIEKHGSV